MYHLYPGLVGSHPWTLPMSRVGVSSGRPSVATSCGERGGCPRRLSTYTVLGLGTLTTPAPVLFVHGNRPVRTRTDVSGVPTHLDPAVDPDPRRRDLPSVQPRSRTGVVGALGGTTAPQCSQTQTTETALT